MAETAGGKGIMMSERPAPGGDGGGGAGGGGGGGEPGVSIGNYKGVMLCNRPFAGGQGAANTAGHGSGGTGSGERKPIVVGLSHETFHPRGWDPSTRERINTVPVRSKANTALSRHKRWLRNLEKQRQTMQQEFLVEEERKAAKTEAFMRQQKKMRDVVRGVDSPSGAGGGDAGGGGDLYGSSGVLESKSPDGPSGSGGELNTSQLQQAILEAEQKKHAEKRAKAEKAAKSAKDNAKPAWAYTEESKAKAEEDEAEELLNFAANLDFDAFVDDVEVMAAIEQAKRALDDLDKEDEEAAAEERRLEREQRIAEARANAVEGKNPDAGEDGGSVRRELTEDALSEWDEGEGKAADRGDAGSIVSAASTAVESIRSVHSKKSISAVIERERKALRMAEPPMGTIAEDVSPKKPPPVVPPLISVIDESGGSRIAKQKHVSQLPYMNRNPAV